MHPLGFLLSFLTEFLASNPYFRFFFKFLTRACLAQISIMSFIVILFLSLTDEIGYRVFIRCFPRIVVCVVIEISSLKGAQLSRCFLPHLHLRTETDPVSETSCYFRIQDDGKSPEKFCEFCTTYTIVRILSSLSMILSYCICTCIYIV
jgi:hypothetical protein